MYIELQHEDLISREELIGEDKQKIEEYIEEMDDRKRSLIEKAVVVVNDVSERVFDCQIDQIPFLAFWQNLWNAFEWRSLQTSA